MKTPLDLALEHARTLVALRGMWCEPLTWEEVKELLDAVWSPAARREALNDAYDEATGKVLELVETGDAQAPEAQTLLEAYRLRSEELGAEVHGLSVAMEKKIAEAVLRAEGDERSAAWNVVLLSIVAALVAADVRVRGFEVAGATLEDRFVDLTGEGFDVES